MYAWGWFEGAVADLERALNEGKIAEREFNTRMAELKRRKAREDEFLKKHPPETYGDDGIFWA